MERVSGFVIKHGEMYHAGRCDGLGRVVWSSEARDAYVYPSAETASRVVAGDERLKGAQVLPAWKRS